MNWLRKLLIEVRRRYGVDPFKSFWVLLAATVATGGISLLLDALTPFSSYWMLIRSIWLIPTTLSTFALLYLASIYIHNVRVNANPEWIAYRARYSQKTRIQFSIIAASLLLVGIYVIPKQMGYTFLSALIASGIVGVLAFVRATSAEQKRQKLGIPDSRDIAYDFYERAYLREQERKKAAQRKKKEARKSR